MAIRMVAKSTEQKTHVKRKRTNEDYINELSVKNPNVIPQEEYITVKTPIWHLYTKCGHLNKTSPASVLQGFGCNQCNKSRTGFYTMKTHDDFVDELNKINSTILVIGKYVGAQKRVQCQCKTCGYIWNPIANSILRGTSCPKCNMKTKLTHEDFMLRMQEKGNPNVIICSQYNGMNKSIKCMCKICGNIWNSIPSRLLIGRGCKKCSDKNNGRNLRKSHDKFVYEISIRNPNVEILSQYTKSTDHIKCRCKICDTIWNPVASSLWSGFGCPSCNTSHGEVLIKHFLDNHNIAYITQYRFDDCCGIGNKPLPYDYYLPEYNKLIEYDGLQHFKPIDFFGGLNGFNTRQEHDRRKTEYANNHNIVLVRIAYYDIDNIEQILSHILNLESVETVTAA